MNAGHLFLKAAEEIDEAASSNDPYRILRASALLRQLLLDNNRLIDVVNRPYKLKIGFMIADSWGSAHTKLVMELKPAFYSILDGLDPDTAIVKRDVIEIGRDQFLSHNVLFCAGSHISVRDCIDHCANVMGGVHFGEAKSDSQKTLSGLQNIQIGGTYVSIRQLVPILRIVSKAIQPLRKKVEGAL